jgi:hypothetical protein
LALVGDEGVLAFLGGFEHGVGGGVDEGAAVGAKGADEGGYLGGWCE